MPGLLIQSVQINSIAAEVGPAVALISAEGQVSLPRSTPEDQNLFRLHKNSLVAFIISAIAFQNPFP